MLLRANGGIRYIGACARRVKEGVARVSFLVICEMTWVYESRGEVGREN